MNHTCNSCPFFFALEGQCRAHPPGAMPIPRGPGEMQIVPIFIPARPDGWCGEHPGRKAQGPSLSLA